MEFSDGIVTFGKIPKQTNIVARVTESGVDMIDMRISGIEVKLYCFIRGSTRYKIK